MRQVWKYPLDPGQTAIDMPKDAQVLAVQAQGTVPMLWAMVDLEAELERRQFYIFGTGYNIPDDLTLSFIDTFQIRDGRYVFHVFEEVVPVHILKAFE